MSCSRTPLQRFLCCVLIITHPCLQKHCVAEAGGSRAEVTRKQNVVSESALDTYVGRRCGLSDKPVGFTNLQDES